MKDPDRAPMTDDDFDAIAALPKIELHLHLEGAAPPGFIRGLARKRNIDIARAFRPDGSYAFRGFAHFLEVYEAATSVLKTPEDYARLTEAVLAESAAEGVVYTEIFASPDFCGGGELGAWQEYLQAISEAAEASAAQGGPELRLIVTCVRHFGPDRARRAALCAAETAGPLVVGFGMGGDETRGRQGDFAWAFDCAREAGLRLTTHGGEWRGPAEVADALDLGVQRIGHGVRAIEDPRLVDRLAEAGTVLEVCPGSNVALGVYPDLADHPIARLRAAGVPVTVSTDDPPFFHTTLRREYRALARQHDWDAAVFAELNRVALAAAFCDEETRRRVAGRLEKEEAR